MMEYRQLMEFQQGHSASVAARVVGAAERFAALVHDSDDAATRRVAATPNWTVNDVVAHVSTMAPRYQAGVEGAGQFADHPRNLQTLNDEAMTAGVRDRSLGELTDEILAGAKAFADVIALSPQDSMFPFHLGVPMSGDQIAGVFLGELLVHGRDIAKELGRRWVLPVGDVGAVFDSLEPLLPGWIDPVGSMAHSATYELRLRHGGVYRWRFDGGVLTTGLPPDTRFDCHIAGTAGSLLLVLYRRISAVRAATTGRAVAWGRRPWLAFTLADRFYTA